MKRNKRNHLHVITNMIDWNLFYYFFCKKVDINITIVSVTLF
jgi:hypothetical protein